MRPAARSPRLLGLALAASAACLLALALLASVSPAASAPIYTFPIPGSRVAAPGTQISFRGTHAQPVITVSGSNSGPHPGTMLEHSDGRGWSFLPTSGFTPGETVTVTGPANVAGSKNGVFHFTIARPAPVPACSPHPIAPRTKGDVLHFRSEPDLAPANVEVLRSSSQTAPGDIFLAPGDGPVQTGPEIFGPRGGLIWSKPFTGNVNWVADFRVQSYLGKPVLTWWQGCSGNGVLHQGQDVIYDRSYRQIATVQNPDGVTTDLHEFQLTPRNTALITSYFPVYWNASSVHGAKNQNVWDNVVQEIDVHSCQVGPCLVLYQWDSLDHVPLSDSEVRPGQPYDYFHLNSVELDKDGQLVISARNTWAAYKISHKTGRIIWQLGGKHSSFQMGAGASFAFQHDVRVHAYGDQYLTVFDDGANAPGHSQSRGLKLKLDLEHKTATMQAQYLHQPPLLSYFEGNVQQLPNFNIFVGWGTNPYFSEFDRNGTLLFDARTVGPNSSYRVYRFPWVGNPPGPPEVAASNSGSKTFVYASWNGATQVASWRVEGGKTPATLKGLKTVAKRGFETTMAVSHHNYVAVQALDSSGHVLGTSNPVST